MIDRRAAILSLLTAGSFLAAVARAASALAESTPDPTLRAAVRAAHRTPAFAARDAARHPAETLAFFGLKPSMTVVEISPGGGWYTEILAVYLREQGRLILAADDPESVHVYYRRGAERLRTKLAANPAVYDRVQLTVFEPPRSLIAVAPGSADRVLTFRNVHNWAPDGDDNVVAVFKSAHAALKPGGVLGVVDHRLPAARKADPKVASGYLHQDHVVRLAQRAGFTLAAASEINANPADTADHEGGVWALPPSWQNKDKDRARYAAIGESDRMTLRFVKG
ncbi:MAG: methyltransferase [Rubrivivax sp.]